MASHTAMKDKVDDGKRPAIQADGGFDGVSFREESQGGRW